MINLTQKSKLKNQDLKRNKMTTNKREYLLLLILVTLVTFLLKRKPLLLKIDWKTKKDKVSKMI